MQQVPFLTPDARTISSTSRVTSWKVGIQPRDLLNHFEFHASHPFCIRDIRRPLPAKPSELWGAGRPRVLLIEPLPDRAAGMDQGELLILIAGLLDERGR